MCLTLPQLDRFTQPVPVMNAFYPLNVHPTGPFERQATKSLHYTQIKVPMTDVDS